MRYDLATMAARQGLKRRETVFPPIHTTPAMANDLARILRMMISPWLACRPRIVSAYDREIERRLQQDSLDELTSLFGQLSDEVDRLILDLTPTMQQWAFKTEEWHRSKWQRAILAGADLDVSTLIGRVDATETIADFMARQTALIRNVSSEARGRIADLVYRGMQQKVPSKQIGKAITGAIGLSRNRANRIAADQAMKISSALDAQRQREAGLTVWQWNHSGKLHFRPAHKARDENWYADAAEDRGTAPSGKEILAPPEDDDLPGIPPYCGCVRQAILILPE